MLLKVILHIRLLRSDSFKRAKLYKRYHDLRMGDKCQCFGKVDFGSEPYMIDIGNYVRLSDNVHFVNHDGGIMVLNHLKWLTNAEVYGKITIGDNVFIGRDSVILKNVIIGDNVVIGAGSIVAKSCESNAVYAGVPARKIKSLADYCDNLKNKTDSISYLSQAEKKDFLMKNMSLYETEE